VASGGATFSPTPVNAPAVADPFANEPVPTTNGGFYGSVVAGSGQTIEASPGTYTTLGASGGGVLTLDPGVYVITTSFTNSGSGQITGDGVTLYFPVGSSLHLSGTSVTNLTSPNGMFGITVFYDRANTNSIATDIGVSATIQGAIYGKASQLKIDQLVAGGLVVVDTVSVASGGTFILNCQQ
ncbi:MAG TPA: hypothetical protein VGJ86_08050, partial [Acidimicrobiales bacterium]|jgi:hypothetical protein